VLQAAATGTILLALARPLTSDNIPESKVEEFHGVWEAARTSRNLAKLREGVWDLVRAWLAYTFHGPAIDEGPLSADVITYPGQYIRAEDTRIFWVPVPQDEIASMPFVCVAMNACSPTNGIDRQDGSPNYTLQQMDDIADLLVPRLTQWHDEGRFHGQCFVLFRYVNIEAFFVWGGESQRLLTWDPHNITSNHWAADIISGDT
jgi:hypothetical protein